LRTLFRLAAFAAALTMLGCSAQLAFREGRQLVDAGQADAGLAKLQEAMKLDPGRLDYRTYYLRQRDAAVERLLAQADTAKAQGRPADADASYRKALALDPMSDRAKQAVMAFASEQRQQKLAAEAEAAFKAGRLVEAQDKARAVLVENSRHAEALALVTRLEEQTARAQQEPQLDAALQRPITLEFRDTDLKAVFELISRTTGINFFFDKDIRPDLRATVFVRDTPIEDVIRFVLVTNQLERKVLNQNTLLIYPNTPAKTKDYQELVTRSFYLSHADVKTTANLIKGMVKTKDVFIDEKLKLLVMRDTPDAIRMAEKLIAAQDIAESEVMLEVEVLEVASNALTELGIRYPDQVTASVVGAGGAGTLTLPEFRNRNSSLYSFSVTNPLLVLNLKQQDGRANTLANPRIRVKDGQKARVHIGDKVPVITTTLSATSFVSESVSYLDVGLKLDVEPSISLSNEVGIKIGLEVSNIVREIRSSSGTLTYQIGTRNAATTLHLRDGETQILAGLISDDERKTADKVPGLGDLPLLGRLFSSHRDTSTKSEIVLLITPRILRAVARPEAGVTQFLSGTESAIGAAPLVMRTAQPAAAAAAPGVAPQGGPSAAPRAVAGPPPSAAVVAKADVRPSLPALAAAPPGLARFMLKGPASVKPGQEFTVAIDASVEAALKAGTFDIAYDPSRFKAVKVEAGEFLKAAKDVSFTPDIQEVEGRVSVSYAAPGDLKGEGTLARITFQVTGPHPGTSLIRMETPSVTDTQGKLLSAPAPVPLTLLLAR
jgi:general secretion pathway protein D